MRMFFLERSLCEFYLKSLLQSDYIQMQGLAAHLKRRNQKILEQELSLPKIPEIVSKRMNQTSIRIHRQKPPIKYVSETTFSPQQQLIHENVKNILKRENEPLNHSHLKQHELFKIQEIEHKNKQSHVLPDIKPVSKRQTPKSLVRISPTSRKSKSLSTKLNLQFILRDKSEFIENYFAELNSRHKK